jgi:hypothetical protein
MNNDPKFHGQELPSAGEVGLEEQISRLEFDWNARPEVVEPLFRLGGIDVCFRGNVTTITGQPKVGKSSFANAMISSTMTHGSCCDCLHVSSGNGAGEAVLRFDTEQDRARHFAAAWGVVARANLSAPPPWFHPYSFKGFSPGHQRRLIELTLATNRKRHGGIHSVFVDGVADLVTDPNRGEECNECITWLDWLAVQYNAAIICVLHLNPVTKFGHGSKGRGHLGSQFERKAETEIRLRRDRDGATSVWTPLARGQPLTVDGAVRFRWDSQQGRHVSANNAALRPKRSKEDKLLEDAVLVLGGVDGELPYSQFVARWSSIHGVSLKTAESKHSALKSLGYITKTRGLWSFNTSPASNAATEATSAAS